MPNPRRAFTYVELTMVVSIIALLAAIAIPNFLEARVRAGVSRSRSELGVLKMAIEAYRTETRAYPQNQTPGQTHQDDLLVLTTPVAYLARLPLDFFTTEQAYGVRVEDPAAPVRYRFFNALQVSPEVGLRFDESSRAPGGLTIGMIWGAGPSHAVASQTQVSPEGVASLMPYDPTNGSSSPGDIYEFLP